MDSVVFRNVIQRKLPTLIEAHAMLPLPSHLWAMIDSIHIYRGNDNEDQRYISSEATPTPSPPYYTYVSYRNQFQIKIQTETQKFSSRPNANDFVAEYCSVQSQSEKQYPRHITFGISKMISLLPHLPPIRF